MTSDKKFILSVNCFSVVGGNVTFTGFIVAIHIFKYKLGYGSVGRVVNVLAFYSNDPSLNPDCLKVACVEQK